MSIVNTKRSSKALKMIRGIIPHFQLCTKFGVYNSDCDTFHTILVDQNLLYTGESDSQNSKSIPKSLPTPHLLDFPTSLPLMP